MALIVDVWVELVGISTVRRNGNSESAYRSTLLSHMPSNDTELELIWINDRVTSELVGKRSELPPGRLLSHLCLGKND